MRNVLWWAALPSLVLASVSCSDSAAPDPGSLLGTWDATKLEFTRVANTSEKVDIIPLGGVFVITLAANDVCTASLTMPQTAPENMTGTWSVSIDVFTLHWTGDTGNTQFDFSLSGSTMTLVGGDVDFDFGNGDEPSKLTVVLVKR
jgi:uncharacterized cupin superfamily protein